MIDLIQAQLDKITQERFDGDKDCPPQFIASIFEDKLIVTISHGGWNYSQTLFPIPAMGDADKWGWDAADLEELVQSLYAKTV